MDHGGVYAYPDAYELSQKYGIKVIYGMEAYMINDENLILSKEIDQEIDDEIIVLDVETTGLSARVGEIIGNRRRENKKITPLRKNSHVSEADNECIGQNYRNYFHYTGHAGRSAAHCRSVAGIFEFVGRAN